MTPVKHIQSRFGIIGREDELALSLAILEAGHHLLLEGPVGVGKTTVALAVCAYIGRPVFRVDGDDRYTENKLTGWFDPPVVLKAGYGPDTFTPGPLIQAMRAGGVLFINELNRMPESVQNVLLPTLDERRLIVPHVGEVTAADGFLVVATQNPVEYVATGHLSEALRDRFEHVGLHYQDEDAETAIVRQATGCTDAALVAQAVRLTRETRSHPRFKKGASIRAAMAMVRIAMKLTGPDALKTAARAALATRVDLKDETGEGLDSILDAVIADLKKKDPLNPASSESNLLFAKRFEAEPEARNAGPGGVEALALRYGLAVAQLDGWTVAERLSQVGLDLADPQLKEEAVRLAAHAVIRRACKLVGPMRIAKRLRHSVMIDPFRGELNVERTLDNTVGKEIPEESDWIVSTREEHERAICLMMDASLSMSGRNLALAALATAVLALKIPEGDLSVVAFDSTARVITRLGDAHPAHDVVEGILRLPARGYTNLEDALEKGSRELARCTHTRRTGLLITDGVYTVGGDPSPWASRFPRLHVLMTQDYKVNEDLCIRLARLGRGELFRVERFEDMPARMLELANRI